MAKSTPINFLPAVKECEAGALLNAILWVFNLGLTHVVLETNVKVVVNVIYDAARENSEFGDIIAVIRSLLLITTTIRFWPLVGKLK